MPKDVQADEIYAGNKHDYGKQGSGGATLNEG